jgi:hypothetical protein
MYRYILYFTVIEGVVKLYGYLMSLYSLMRTYTNVYSGPLLDCSYITWFTAGSEKL